MYSTRYSCQMLMMPEFSWQILKKYSYQISWKCIQWELSCSMRIDAQTDRHDEGDGHFAEFFEHA